MREFTSAAAEGEVNPLEGLSFKLDGETFECLGYLSLVELAELARVASAGGHEMQDAATLGLIAEQFRQAFGDEEYMRFREHLRAHKTPASVQMEILRDLSDAIQGAVQEATGRPTVPLSPSGSGEPEPDGRISRVISLQTGDVRVIQHPHPQDHEPPDLSGKQDAAVRRPARSGGGKPRQRRTG